MSGMGMDTATLQPLIDELDGALVVQGLHPPQREIFQSPARFKVVAAGRRFGKTRLGVVLAYCRAALGYRAWWVGPTFPVASIAWRSLRTTVRQFPGSEIKEADRIINLPGGGWIQVKSADNPDSLRGEGLDLAILDEAAYMAREAWTEAIRPALTDRRGHALFISTPNGLNWFHDLWQAAQGRDWARFQFPTSANPHISPDEIEGARRDLPDFVFSQEYLAEFVDRVGLPFFDLGVLNRCVSEDVREPVRGEIALGQFVKGLGRCRLAWWGQLVDGRPRQDRNYVAGADVSKGTGASNSPCSFVDTTTGEQVGQWCDSLTMPHDFAANLDMLCRWVGGQTGVPYLAWEANNDGLIVGRVLRELGYPAVYHQRREEAEYSKPQGVPGWHSDRASKQLLLSDYRRGLAERRIILHSAESVKEARQYVYAEDGSIGPSSLVEESPMARATHGDRVIADALALLALREQPKAKLPQAAPSTGSALWRLGERRRIQEAKDAW